jgi:hypothetical protein
MNTQSKHWHLGDGMAMRLANYILLDNAPRDGSHRLQWTFQATWRRVKLTLHECRATSALSDHTTTVVAWRSFRTHLGIFSVRQYQLRREMCHPSTGEIMSMCTLLPHTVMNSPVMEEV